MEALRDFVYVGINQFDRSDLATRLGFDEPHSLECELRVNRTILRSLGVVFIGSPSNPFAMSWNGSSKEGYALNEIRQALQDAHIDISPENIVADEFAYIVRRGADFTYRFVEKKSPSGTKYHLVKDALVWD